jgi:selenide,water dikinase
VGIETSDDAAVYRLTDDIAVISTTDFITPPVDDPYWFGQIAAANALSDVYSMGGRPIIALNLVMFPTKHLDMGLLREILHGGHDKVVEAGACLVGGHSVEDEEPKYGLSVNGIVHPDRVITNAGARAGDALILTKPIGTGVLLNAVRSRRMKLADIEEEVLPALAALNGKAIETALEFDLHACTDITGFGLAGHCLEVARGSGSTVRLEFATLPIHRGSLRMYRKGETTGSNLPNRSMVAGDLSLRVKLSRTEEELLFDPQTSGGLLLSVPQAQSDALLRALSAAGVPAAARIGSVVDGPPVIEVV